MIDLTHGVKGKPFDLFEITGDIAHLGIREAGAYIRLIETIIRRKEDLPGGRARIYHLARATTPEDQAVIDSVLAEFFVMGSHGDYRHPLIQAAPSSDKISRGRP